MNFKKIFYLLFLVFLVTGFRMYPKGNNWPISSSDSKLWLVICPELAAMTWATNDLPTDDPLYNQSGLTFNQIIDSIATDYNNVANSFITLANSATDGTYNTTIAAQRSIRICTGSAPGASGGYAKPKSSGDSVIGCDISLTSARVAKLKDFVGVVTHEIGHCLGFDHSQDTTHAIMSYFHDPNKTRLQIDDKMGLIYMYPDNPAEAKESMTFGLACSPRN